ncbi:MAG TPA: BlaI/MecI/CopY family transcriptional regulator [bacterium]|nr:BlaI/MecI/CopY family transcriptional regulator [bacterium]
MRYPQPPRPTDAELNILRVLWERGPSTVREVQEQLNRSKLTGYTTVLKLLQIMTEKELVSRDESERSHVYEAKYPETLTQNQLVCDLLERAFGGSMSKLVLQALDARKASAEDLEEIRRILDQLQGETK